MRNEPNRPGDGSPGPPIPPLATQRELVVDLEAERKLVEANRDLIARMEAKIQAKLAEVWGKKRSTP